MPLLLFYAIYNSDLVKPKLKIPRGPIEDRQAENFKAWLSLQIKLLSIIIDIYRGKKWEQEQKKFFFIQICRFA